MQKFFDCGIDLGTTNSCLAISDNDHGFEIIENQADRMQVTPSAVLINSKGRMLIGQRAYNSQKVEDLAIQFKRSMGTNKTIHFESANLRKTPEELSSEILKVLRNDVESRLNRPIENVVITVPAAFKTLQSEATNKAGKLAGFKNIILLQEPIAAAVAYGAKPDAKDKHWMVFDYGGGTLDVAIISTLENRLTVENSEGDNYFGGGDIDRLIYTDIVLKKLTYQGYNVSRLLDESTSSGKSLARKIQLDCESCKIELSKSMSAFVELFDIEDDNGEPIEFECEITREELESLISSTVEKAIEIAKKALKGANMNSSQLDKILLVGGSTFIPLVRRRLTEEFGVELDSSLNPMTVVAAGAAIYASTNVIDVDEEIESTDASHAIINLTYDPITSEEKVNVIGKITNIEDLEIEKIKIDCATSDDFSGVDWTSGWVELLDNDAGIFDIDVVLLAGKTNHFKVSACNKSGTDVIIENPYFDIKHNVCVLKTSAPPATMSIGVQIKDSTTGYEILYPLIKKNTPLPASGEQVFKLSRTIDPSTEDCIQIKIWEGENFINPEANHSAGVITVQASSIHRIIHKGTVVELTVTEDEDRKIRVTGYIPDLECEIPEYTLRGESKLDLADTMDNVDRRIKQAEVSLQYLKRNGINTPKLESALQQIRSDYSKMYQLVDTDEKSVNDFIEKFNDIETHIIQQERDCRKKIEESNKGNEISNAKEAILRWGDTEAKLKLENLKSSYEMAQSDDEKAFVLEQVKELVFETKFNSFDWLSGFFFVFLSQPETKYTNPQKAEFWKVKAFKAHQAHNTLELRKATFELCGLLTSSASDAIASFTSDLTV
jgi:molecular chaperone DnaK